MSVHATLPNPHSDPQNQPPELHGILESRVFEKSPALRRLLLYLWDHRSEEISEYAIATEALERRADFDPRSDSAVRVQVARLRQKLKEYYDDEGKEEPSRITVPLGSYNLQLHLVSSENGVPSAEEAPSPSLEEPSEISESNSRSRRNLWIGVAIVASAALGCFAGIGWQASKAAKETQTATIRIPPVWGLILLNGKPERIVVPNPVFFSWIDKSGETLTARDPVVNSYKDSERSAKLTTLVKTLGQPILAQDYTVASDTQASFRLARYLEPFRLQIDLSSSSDLPPEAPDSENLILLGTINTLTPYRLYLDRLHYRFPEHSQAIVDIAPVAGKPSRFDTVRESPSRSITPGIVALLPGRAAGTSVLIIVGYHTNALVSYLTSTAGLDDLQKARAANGNPRFFEGVVLSEVNNINPLRSWVVSFKSFRE